MAQALSADAPVVALESTIITHGMPYPANLQTAREVEAVVREHGARFWLWFISSGGWSDGVELNEWGLECSIWIRPIS